MECWQTIPYITLGQHHLNLTPSSFTSLDLLVNNIDNTTDGSIRQQQTTVYKVSAR